MPRHIIAIFVVLAFAFLGTSMHIGCGGEESSNGDPTPTPTPDSNAPQITSKNPDDGDTDIARNADITITFDKEMDEASVEAASSIIVDDGSGAVTATRTYASGDRSVTINPGSSFGVGATVTVIVTTDVTDADGNALSQEISWTFTCSDFLDNTPPTFAGITGASDNENGTATLTWAAADDDFTATNAITYRAYLAGTSTLVGSIRGQTSLITSQLAADNYDFTVRARDNSGNEDTNMVSENTDITITPASISFADDVFPLFANCDGSSCHDATEPEPNGVGEAWGPPGLNLSSSDPSTLRAKLVNIDSAEKPTLKLVEPGDSSASYLYLKLSKVTGDPSIEGVQMPKSGSKFNSTKLAIVEGWISAGALDN